MSGKTIITIDEDRGCVSVDREMMAVIGWERRQQLPLSSEKGWLVGLLLQDEARRLMLMSTEELKAMHLKKIASMDDAV